MNKENKNAIDKDIDMDALLREAYQEDPIASLWEIDVDENAPIHPSGKFLRHMRILEKDPLRFMEVRQRERRRKQFLHTWAPRLQKAACFLLVFALLGGVALIFSSESTRASLTRIFQKDEPGFSKYEIDENAQDSSAPFVPWGATWVPDGYSLKEREDNISSIYTEIYENETGGQLFIISRSTAIEQNLWNDSDHGNIDQISVNGMTAYSFSSTDELWLNAVYWFDEDHNIYNIVRGSGSIPTLHKVAERMRPIA